MNFSHWIGFQNSHVTNKAKNEAAKDNTFDYVRIQLWEWTLWKLFTLNKRNNDRFWKRVTVNVESADIVRFMKASWIKDRHWAFLFLCSGTEAAWGCKVKNAEKHQFDKPFITWKIWSQKKRKCRIWHHYYSTTQRVTRLTSKICWFQIWHFFFLQFQSFTLKIKRQKYKDVEFNTSFSYLS